MSTRAGRRRKLAERHSCGKVVQPSQVQLERETRSIVIDARQRVFGLRKAEAEMQEASDALGRALLRGEITVTQRNAGQLYERIQHAYKLAILAMHTGSGSDMDRTGGFDDSDGDDPEYVERCNAARRQMADSRRALLDADPLAQLAVDAWTMEGKEVTTLLVELRIGLNALAKLYRVSEWA